MTAATWTTAPIPAYRLAVGDKVTVGSTTVVLETVVDEGRSVILGPIQYDIDEWTAQFYYLDQIAVHVPDEPVDGYALWKPKPTTWPSGCVCVHRRSDGFASNWDAIPTAGCRGHYDRYEED